MPQVFLIADTHFSHAKICSFVRDDGSPLRPWNDVEEMDEALVDRWNSIVRPKDKVYHLGDVAIPRRGLKLLERLNGDKILIAGNHDSCFMPDMHKYFRAIRAYWKLDEHFLSHVPIHTNSLRKFGCNIHGHLHYRQVEFEDGTVDPRYLCVCVEHTNYAPIAWEDVVGRINLRQAAFSRENP